MFGMSAEEIYIGKEDTFVSFLFDIFLPFFSRFLAFFIFGVVVVTSLLSRWPPVGPRCVGLRQSITNGHCENYRSTIGSTV